MPGLEDLYREIVLDHCRNPRNRGELPSPPAVRSEGLSAIGGLSYWLDDVSAAGFVDAAGVADAGEDIRQRPPLRIVITHVVDRDRRQADAIGQSLVLLQPFPVVAVIAVAEREIGALREVAAQAGEEGGEVIAAA